MVSRPLDLSRKLGSDMGGGQVDHGYLFLAQQPPVAQGLLIHAVSRSHTTTPHVRYDYSGRVISLSLRPLPDDTQHTQETDSHASGGIRIHNLSRRSATDVRLRLRGHWDRRPWVLRTSFAMKSSHEGVEDGVSQSLRYRVTQKNGNFWKPNKNWRNPSKKKLLTEIEPLQLAF